MKFHSRNLLGAAIVVGACSGIFLLSGSRNELLNQLTYLEASKELMDKTEFSSAVAAVEDRNHLELLKVIQERPTVLSFSAYENCSLYCEFSGLFRTPLDGEVTPQVDEIAIEILLKSGADPKFSPYLVGTLLSKVNVAGADEDDCPAATGVCSEERNVTFPLVNEIISNGGNLGVMEDVDFSADFFYISQLCNPIFMCGASYEKISVNIGGLVGAALIKNESEAIRILTDKGVIKKNAI